jgi:hypothetical protein
MNFKKLKLEERNREKMNWNGEIREKKKMNDWLIPEEAIERWWMKDEEKREKKIFCVVLCCKERVWNEKWGNGNK